MAQSPAFSFYAKDFLLGTATFSLSERGAYITLLSYQWDTGSVPDDAVERARLMGCSKKAAAAVWARVGQKFQRGEDGMWRNVRLEAERTKQSDRRAALSANGSKGGRPRKLQETNSFLTVNQTESLPSPSPSPEDLPVPSEPPDPSPALKGAPVFARATQTAGVMAGTLPRDHLNCHPPCIRVCISEKQHAILRERHGGTDGDMEAFYADVRANLNGPVGQRPWQFWDEQFAARFAAPPVNSKTAGNLAAVRQWLEKSGVQS